MNESTAPRFKFGAAAHGIGITAKTLRNWLQREQVELLRARAEDEAHFKFSMADLAILSVVAELVRYGMPVRRAFDEIGPLRRQIAVLSTYNNVPLAAMGAMLLPMNIVVRNDGKDWHVWFAGAAEQAGDDGKFPSFLVVSAASCLGEVLRRVRQFEETSDAFRKQFGDKDAEAVEALMADGLPDDLEFGAAVPLNTPKHKE